VRCRADLQGTRGLRCIAIALGCAAAIPSFAEAPAAEPPSAGPPAAPSTAPPPTAAARPTTGRFFLAVGYDLGGTKLVQAQLSNGTTPSITANGGFVAAAGVDVFPLGAERLRTRATLGVKYDAIKASNGSIAYIAFPLEVVELVELAPFRVGAGLSLSIAPSLSGSGVAEGIGASMENSLGVVFQGEHEWRVGGQRGSALVLGPRVLWQRLRFEATGKAVDATAVGLYLGWMP
jgi:hypothetical protein